MKPSWDEAPEWANWLAMDGNGLWYWYEVEPDKSDILGYFYAENGGKYVAAISPTSEWTESLARRP